MAIHLIKASIVGKVVLWLSIEGNRLLGISTLRKTQFVLAYEFCDVKYFGEEVESWQYTFVKDVG